MEKYVGTFADGYMTAVWAAGDENAELHLKDWCRLHGDLVDIKKVFACPEDNEEETEAA